MLYGYLSYHYFISGDNSMSTGRVYDEQENGERAPLASIEHQRPFFVTFSARLISSAGLGLSILAIWLRWFVPSSTVVFEPKPTQSKYRRRSTPSLSITPAILPAIRRATTPLLPSVLKISQEPSSNRHRRVYFIDSKLPTIKSQQILTSDVHPSTEAEVLEQLVVQTTVLQSHLEDSCPSSFTSSTTLVTSHEIPSLNFDSREESIAESDCSSRRSSISIRLPKMNPFLARGRRGSSTSDTVNNSPMTSTATTLLVGPKPIKKSSVGLAAPWSINKARTTTAETPPEDRQTKSSSPSRLSFRRLSGSKHPTNTIEPAPPSPSDVIPISSSSPLTTYFSRKPQRRSSTPVPIQRTLPYEAPYFATPPIPFDATYSAYLRGLPQFGDDMSLEVARAEMTRGRGPRQENNETRISLGLGRPRLLPKRRSASEGWKHVHSPPV